MVRRGGVVIYIAVILAYGLIIDFRIFFSNTIVSKTAAQWTRQRLQNIQLTPPRGSQVAPIHCWIAAVPLVVQREQSPNA